jgi:hypothetical protein
MGMRERLAAYEMMRRLSEVPPQAEGLSFGALPSPWDPRDYRYQRLVATAVELPAEWSFRPNLSPPWNQGMLGTCVAAATCWGCQAYDEINQGDFPAQGLSVAFLYTECKRRDGYPGAGTYPRVAMQVLQQVGVCPEQDMPYSVLTRDTMPLPLPSQTAYQNAQRYRIQTYAALCTFDDASRDAGALLAAIKTAIIREGPVLGAVVVHRSFLYPKAPDYLLPVPNDDAPLGGHAVCLTGWSDAKQAFEMRNSWGTSWGDGGYAWLPYVWLTATRNYGWCFMEAWTTVDMVVPKPASKIVLRPNSTTAWVDGVEMWLDQPAVVDNATWRMLVPVRFMAGNMGYLVEWTGSEAVLTRPQA